MVRESRRSEQRLHDLIDTVAAVVSEFDIRTRRFTYVSGATEVVTGYPASAFLADERFWSDRIFAADRRRVFDLYEQAVRTGQDYGLDYRFRASDDSIRWMRGDSQIVKDGFGRPTSIRTVTIDATETREAIAAAEHSHSLLAATLDSTVDGILVVDREERVTVSNRRFAEMWYLAQALVDSGDTEALLAAISNQFTEPKTRLAKMQDGTRSRNRRASRCSNWLTDVCSSFSPPPSVWTA